MFQNTEKYQLIILLTFVYFLVIHIVQTLELLGEASTAGGTRASVALITFLIVSIVYFALMWEK